MGRQGKLVIFSAPSGSGKTTIVRRVLPMLPRLAFSVSATSRQMRPGEQNGKDYYFLTADDFRKAVAAGDFLEYEEVYAGQFYGTLKSELTRIWAQNQDVVFDVDVKGGLRIKEQFPKQSLAIFIQPPSVAELKRRLEGRGTETPETLKKRLDRAEEELSFAPRFDLRIINDDLERAVAEVQAAVTAFLQAE
ncbi:MAG: guanylate kinase [Bacteroidales bacterium]|nr:guanylate kinase [Bacteroidales bacterium]